MKREYRFKKAGITEEKYLALLESQGGGCAICGAPPQPDRRLSVDHNHACCDGPSCGKCVRGLLCDGCNVVLGRVKDSQRILTNMVEYLHRFDYDEQ